MGPEDQKYGTTPGARGDGESFGHWLERNKSVASTTSSATPDSTLSKKSASELRQLWRAGAISEADWKAELLSRNGGDEADAADEIATQKNTGVSTAAKTKGQLTAAEAADVEAIRTTRGEAAAEAEKQRLAGVAQTGDVDSYENPARAAQGLSSVTDANDPASYKALQGTTSTATSGGSSATKLPLTPLEELQKKQADAIEQQRLKAQLRQMAEDQYILNSGGKVSRTQDGRLESTEQASGGYSAVVPHEYDEKTGLISAQQPVGWRQTNPNGSSSSGNTLDPRGAVWNSGENPSIPWEDIRRLPIGDRSTWIRTDHPEVGWKGREPTSADLLSGPGGQFPGGDPQYMQNLAALRNTGKILPGTGSVVNPFAPGASGVPNGGDVPTQLRFGQTAAPPEMSQREYDFYRFTGGIPGANGATEESLLGGRTLGELQNDSVYGTDALPESVRRKWLEDIANGTIGDIQQYAADASGRGRSASQKSIAQREQEDGPQYQADGGANMTGMARPARNFMQDDGEQNFAGLTRDQWGMQPPAAGLPQMGAMTPATPQGGMNAEQPNTTAYTGAQPGSWLDMWNQGKVWNPVTGQWENARPNGELQSHQSTPLNVLSDEEYFSRGSGYLPNYSGTGHGPGLKPMSGTFFAEGGVGVAGRMPARITTGGLQYPGAANAGPQPFGSPPSVLPPPTRLADAENGTPRYQNQPLPADFSRYGTNNWYDINPAYVNMVMHGYKNGPVDAYSQPGALDYLTGGRLGGMPRYAAGGGFQTDGPVLMSKLEMGPNGQPMAGEPLGVTGEAGPEAVVNVPLSRPAAPGLPSMVQQMMQGGGQQAAMGGAPPAPQMPPGLTPLDMLRQQAKLMRPRVSLRVGG